MVTDAFDQVDALGAEELRSLENERLERLVRWARRKATLYRERLGLIDRVERLPELPLLSKEDLVAGSPPRGNGLLAGPLEKAVVFKTGGTTGMPKYIAYSHQDFRRLARSTGRALWASGLRPGDRVANCFAVGELYASFLAIHRAVEVVGATSFPFTFHASQDQILECLDSFGINAVMGLATQMVHLLDRVSQEQPQTRIEKVFYAAEHLHPEERRHIEEQNAPDLITTACYGAVDGGMIGHQCPHSPGSIHHIMPGTVIVEILDRETLEPTDGVGELVVTNLERRLMPVIRYRLGDLARWVEEPCPCGRPSPRFELLGRGDEQLRVGYDTVTHEDARLSLAHLGSFSSVIQLVKQRDGGKDRLILRVETRGANPSTELTEQARRAFLERKPLLREHIENGYIHQLVVEVIPPHGLERKHHSGKFARVIDESYPG